MAAALESRSIRVRRIAQMGVMMAGVATLTLFIRVPIPMTRGYINLGDLAVVAFAMLAGPRRGALIGGLGSALADVMGFPQFVPATLVAKGLEGWFAGLGASLTKEKRGFSATFVRFSLAAFGGMIMVGTYYAYQGFLLGWKAALLELPGNCFQLLAGSIGGTILYHLLHFSYGLDRIEAE